MAIVERCMAISGGSSVHFGMHQFEVFAMGSTYWALASEHAIPENIS